MVYITTKNYISAAVNNLYSEILSFDETNPILKIIPSENPIP